MRFPLLRLLRPEQWIKNLLVMAPWVFAGLARDIERGSRALAAAVLFTAASALVYVFNDLRDREHDRAHPRKRHTRPIAAGMVIPRAGMGLLAVLGAYVAAGAVFFPAVRLPVIAFVAVNALYSVALRNVPVIDLLTVSAGYLLRVYAGAEAVDVPLSSWMALATLFLSLFLISSKRYAERVSGETAGRRVLASYSPGFLNAFHWIAGAATFACYTAYVILVQPAILVTIPIVALGLTRFALVTASPRRSESPSEVLSRDWVLLGCVLFWGIICVAFVPAG